jgi:hypothetical protein
MDRRGHGWATVTFCSQQCEETEMSVMILKNLRIVLAVGVSHVPKSPERKMVPIRAMYSSRCVRHFLAGGRYFFSMEATTT